MEQLKYTTFDHKFSNAFSGVKEESYSYVKLPYENSKNAERKILFVLDYMPGEDLRTARLLSGVSGDVLSMLVKITKKFWIKHPVEFSWLAVTFNAYKTAGKPRDYQQQAREEFTIRIKALIDQYKPDVVIGFGRSVIQSLAVKQMEMTEGNWTNWLGVPMRLKTDNHKYQFVGTLSINPVANASATDASLIGYMTRNLANGLTGKHNFAIDAKRIKAHRTILIDTIGKFDKMLDMMAQQPAVCIDTETAGLNRIVNKLLIIQFAKCVDFGYVVPVMHKDTPFTPEEIRHITKRLRSYFQGNNKNKYQIYAHAQFDLNIIREQVKCAYMATPVWDIFSGEFGIDENLKGLENVTGSGYYSLGNLTIQYGSTAYFEGTFGKEDRGSIVNRDLDDDLLRYCSYDVVIPWAIHEKQLEIANHLGHTGYETLITGQFSDMLHVFSRMENTGCLLDINYLFLLKAPNSPIEQTIEKMEKAFYDLDTVKKANAKLLRTQGVPATGLFGSTPISIFSLRKDAHKKLLFFGVLKLAPIKRGQDGEGRLDKTFQEAYADVPEVKYYTELGRAKKLKNAYVNSFIKLLGKSDDLKSDHRIRPSYHYLKVITGRSSASNPNLQQVPAHSELGKNIKRLFIARVGALYIKVDYRVHEVRGWGLIAFDLGVAEVFKAAKALRDSYRARPTPEMAKRLKLEADVHVINAAYFFTIAIEKVDKVLRNAVKSVIFGLIYQMSINSLAKKLDKPLEFTKNLVKNFTKRFPRGMGWIEETKKIARKLLFIENPLGFRRHLWGYCLPESVSTSSNIHAGVDRRAVNSPIQGMCAQFMSIGARALDSWVWEIWKTEKRKVDLMIENSVHDSLENTAAYENILESIGMIEEALTTKVKEIVFKRHGFKFVVDLEIDFEVGPALSHTEAWDFSLAKLEKICFDSLIFQRDELGRTDVNVDECMEKIFIEGWTHAPKWMKVQAKNTGWKLDVKSLHKQKRQEVLAKQQAAEEAKTKLKKAA